MAAGEIAVDDGKRPEIILKDLSDRAERLLGELKQFQQLLKSHGKLHESEIRVFRRGVQSEVKSLQTIRNRQGKRINTNPRDEIDSGDDQANYVHALNSSNLPFYEAVWQTAKTCRGITGLGRRVYCQPCQSESTKLDFGAGENKLGASIDIVADNGLEWTKVSTINNKRLLFEIAKQGWESYGDFSSDEDDDEASAASHSDKDVNNQIELVKTAETIMKASFTHRVRFKHPHVRFVLPNVRAGEYDDVDAVLQALRDRGILVLCGSMESPDVPVVPLDVELDADRLDSLLPDSPSSALNLTGTLNIDCTILLALISDISHIAQESLPPRPENTSGTYHKAILRQIEDEKANTLLPNELYPILENKVLNATSYAVERMFKIVHTMGTNLEQRRAELFFGQGVQSNKSADQLRQELADLSCHAVPPTLKLPINVLEFQDLPTDAAQLPDLSNLNITNEETETLVQMPPSDMTIARDLTKKMTLSKINQSVFLYGWSQGIVTITSNKVVATSIIKAIGEILDEHEGKQHEKDTLHKSTTQHEITPTRPADCTYPTAQQDPMANFIGPKIYICETARSLIGKEKQIYPIN